MASAKSVIGSRPGTHRVRAYTRSSKSGLVSVRQHTASNTLQTNRSVRSPDLKIYMAKKASSRSAAIRAARNKALSHKY